MPPRALCGSQSAMTEKQDQRAQDKFQAAMRRVNNAGLAIQEDKRRQKEKDAKERLENPHIGDWFAGKGVYVGQWRPLDSSIRQIFNVYAAPEDMPGQEMAAKKPLSFAHANAGRVAYTYAQAVRAVGGLKNWHGHDGEKYANELALYDALKKETYKGGWIIPPFTILNGETKKKSGFHDLKDKGAFRGTFEILPNGIEHQKPHWYWSSSYENKAHWVYVVQDGAFFMVSDKKRKVSLRPVRLERVSKARAPVV